MILLGIILMVTLSFLSKSISLSQEEHLRENQILHTDLSIIRQLCFLLLKMILDVGLVSSSNPQEVDFQLWNDHQLNVIVATDILLIMCLSVFWPYCIQLTLFSPSLFLYYCTILSFTFILYMLSLWALLSCLPQFNHKWTAIKKLFWLPYWCVHLYN